MNETPLSRQLLAELTDADEETRAAALEARLIDMDDEIAQALLDIAASDAGEEARARAIVALGPVIEECGGDYMEGAIDFGPEMGPPVSRETFASIVARIRGPLFRREAAEADPAPCLRGADPRSAAVAPRGHSEPFRLRG